VGGGEQGATEHHHRETGQLQVPDDGRDRDGGRGRYGGESADEETGTDDGHGDPVRAADRFARPPDRFDRALWSELGSLRFLADAQCAPHDRVAAQETGGRIVSGSEAGRRAQRVRSTADR
jgi:hypothetical protein